MEKDINIKPIFIKIELLFSSFLNMNTKGWLYLINDIYIFQKVLKSTPNASLYENKFNSKSLYASSTSVVIWWSFIFLLFITKFLISSLFIDFWLLL